MARGQVGQVLQGVGDVVSVVTGSPAVMMDAGAVGRTGLGFLRGRSRSLSS